MSGGAEAAADVVARTRLFTLAESLGAVESLIEHPAVMTHLSVAGCPLEVDPALIRLASASRPSTTSSPTWTTLYPVNPLAIGTWWLTAHGTDELAS